MSGRIRTSASGLLNSSAQRILPLAIIGITLIGFYLRYRCLGCLGFRWDEDLTSLAVKALSEKGIPELPSGMIYPRFYLYQWVTAASVYVFGFSEFSMRLPAVLFGTIMIPTVYWITARLFDKPVAFIVAACIALSFWQVEMARTARMYAPFFLVYLIAAYSIYRAYFQNTERVFCPWVLPLAVLALSIHQLAYSLAILVLLAIPLRKSARRTVSLLLQACGIGMAFIAIKSIEQYYFDIPGRVARSTDSSELSLEHSGLFEGLLQQVSLPNFELLRQIFAVSPIAVLTAVAVLLMFAVPALKVARAYGISYLFLVVTAIALSVAHQFNLVAMTLAILLILTGGGIKDMTNPAWYRPALVCGSVLVGWLFTIAIVSTLPVLETKIVGQGGRRLLRTLFDYPNFRLFWSHVLQRPLLSVPLVLGTLWAIDRISQTRPDPKALFLLGGFWLVLFANGILDTQFDFFRYSMHVDPFFFMLVVSGMLATPEILNRFGTTFPDRVRNRFTKRFWIATAAAIAIVGVNPVSSILTSHRDYSEASFPFTVLGLDEYRDFATPAEYVRERMTNDDIILVLEPREFWNYIGRVDFWIRTSNYDSQTFQKGGRAFDNYLGIPLLHSVDEVRAVLAGRGSRGVWILFSRPQLIDSPWLSLDLKTYLTSIEDKIVYTARDRQTVVIRMPPDSAEH